MELKNLFVFLAPDNKYYIGYGEDLYGLDKYSIQYISQIYDDVEFNKLLYCEYNAKHYCNQLGYEMVYFETKELADKFLDWIESRLLARKLNGDFE